MEESKRPLFEEFVDFCLRECQLAQLEQQLAAGPVQADLDKWNLMHEEWQMALEKAIAEYKDLGARGKAK